MLSCLVLPRFVLSCLDYFCLDYVQAKTEELVAESQSMGAAHELFIVAG